jgi:plastocyanin
MGGRRRRGLPVLAIFVAVLLGACGESSEGADTAASSPSSAPATTQPADTTTTQAASTTSTILSLESTTESVEEAPAGSIRVEMTGPPPHFVTPDLTATAGDVVFYLLNTGPEGDPFADHNMLIGPEVGERIVKSDRVKPGQTAAFTVFDLPAGEYAIWCTLDDHHTKGHVGTLTVVEE